MYKSNVYNAKNINNKNIDNIKNINFSNEKKNTLILTSVEVIDELLNNFFKNQIDKKLAFLFYHNIYSKYSCDKVIEIILSKLIFIKINFYQLKLYKSPLFFLVKKNYQKFTICFRKR